MSALIERYRPGTVEAADSRRAYQAAAKSYREHHSDHVPATGGYVIFWHGQAKGWTESIKGKPNGWLEDCVAVPSDPSGFFYVARGGTYMDGAERWEAIAQ